jgi:hypothetical protein
MALRQLLGAAFFFKQFLQNTPAGNMKQMNRGNTLKT